MTPPVKFGLAALGTAGVATSAYYGVGLFVGKPKVNREDAMPSWRPLDKDAEFSQSTQPSEAFNGKYGADNARFLVGTGADVASAEPTSNQDWWNWSFRRRYDGENAKGGFGKSSVTRGAKGSNADNNSLQEACDRAYKSEKSKIISGDTEASGDDKFKEEQLWKFCTAVGVKPKTIAEMENVSSARDKIESGTSGKWNGKLGANKKDKLLAIYAPENVFTWEMIDGQFEREKTSITGFFSKTSTNGPSIRRRCEDAYGITVTGEGDDKPDEAGLYKWCSFKGRKTD